MTQQDQNRDLVLALYKNVDARNFARCRELASSDCRTYIGGQVLDREGWTAMGEMFMGAFPDGRHVFDFVDAAGDYVLLNGYFTGTHTQEFQGIPVTGKVIKISLTTIDKVRDGRIVEHRSDFDSAALFQQLSAGG
jgi:predicted ester cyclase